MKLFGHDGAMSHIICLFSYISQIATGWYHSTSRKRTYKFTNAYTKTRDNTFLYVKNGNPRNVNPSDLTDKVIGFIDGFIQDEFCIKRQEGITVSHFTFNSI